MKRTLVFTDGKELPVGMMFCVGSNYSKHAREMGGTIPAEPVIFLKPSKAYLQNGESIKLPDFSELVHHEVELVVVIGKDCDNITADEARDYIEGYAVGIDVTLRDIQNQAKKEGKPWAVSKGFVTSAPISVVIPSSLFHEKEPCFDLSLKVNGEVRQQVHTSEMERTVGKLLEYLSKVFTLQAGDVIFTGTPEGVGQIKKGDTIEAELVGYANLKVFVE